ncbi:MAG: hypothetical protein H6601_11360 [Flavobacteriales bacterium]|nr:hypothetical protein [Flavobacteriales bacterium]
MSLLTTGCKQDVGNANWDVDILAPVIHTKLNMADLIADSLLTSSADGGLRLKVSRPLIDLPLDSILKIPDTTIQKGFSAQFAFNNIPPGFTLPSLSDETQYDLGQLALKYVKVRSGQLKLKVKSVVQTELDFEYRIPLATKFGNMFISTGSIARGSIGDTATAEYVFDLRDYRIDLRGFSGTSLNTLATAFTVNTSFSGDTVSIPIGTTYLILEYGFQNIIPDYGAGYFGQESSDSENETSELDVLNRITDGQMFLDSVNIGLHVINGVGADVRFNLDQLASINTRTGSTVDLNHSIIGNTILLTRAQDVSGNAEDVIPYVVDFNLNNGNSNIKNFIENLPDQLGYTFGFDLNPLGNISGGNDFFYYDRPFQALMDIDIPLRTSLNNLTLVDTVDWNLSSTGFIESVNSGTFTLKAINGLPLEGQVEITMMDDNLVGLGTLVAPSTIAAPPLNAENRVISPLETIINIPIPESLADVLPQTKKVHIKVRFNTPNQPDLIELYDTYGIDLKLIGNFNINFGTSVF